MTIINEDDSWTEPEYLDQKDWNDLKQIQKLYLEDKYEEALSYASSVDTIVREQVSPDIWLAMGGTLTPKGYERLEELKQSREKGKDMGGRESSLDL